MPLLIPADLSTHLYAEIITEITRGDTSIATQAIEAAEKEAKMYLGRYDLAALFGTDADAPTVTDAYLKSIVKDIACWQLLRLSNAGPGQAAYRALYENAIASLKDIMAGLATPEGWPYAIPPAITTDGDTVSWSSNDKRNNYY